MSEILTKEEKKYLRMISNYLGSLGMRTGVIAFELEYDQVELTEEDINWEYITHFDNNYRAEIPENLYPILKKILSHVIESNVFESPDFDTLNNQGLEIEIDCTRQEITVSNWFSYYDTSDGSSVEYDSDMDKERFERWVDEDLQDVEVPQDGYLFITYNGSGDSGYIESSFEGTNTAVPASIENWCYDELEQNFGGWEINEGSEGRFEFNFNDFTVLLTHTYNTEESGTNTLFEENFGA